MEHPAIRVGRTEVAVVCEGYAPLPLEHELPGSAVDWSAERDAHPWAFHDRATWAWHVHAFALHTPAGLVLVDAGVSPFPPYAPWAEHTPLEDALATAGVVPSEVRVVVLTHLHADHAGGAVVDGEPRYPNARHLVHPDDWERFAGVDGYVARRPLEVLAERGQLDLDPGDREVIRGVRVVHAPGHTPGHRAVVLEDGGEALLLVGDLLHVPPQAADPLAPSSHDEDPDLGARSRARWLAHAREHGWWVAVSHFGRPLGTVGPRGWRSQP